MVHAGAGLSALLGVVLASGCQAYDHAEYARLTGDSGVVDANSAHGPRCGDGICATTESCSNCPNECGRCCTTGAPCMANNCSVGGTCCSSPSTYTGTANSGGLGYVNWDFGTTVLSSIDTRVCFLTVPSGTSSFYYQGYDFAIDGSGTAHGLQSQFARQQFIFTRFGTSSVAEARLVAAGATIGSSPVDGGSITLAAPYAFGVGCYTMRIARAEYDGAAHDWFNASVRNETTGIETLVGGIRFPRRTVGVPATFLNGGGSWVSDSSPESSPFVIPYHHFTCWTTANLGVVQPSHALSAYPGMPSPIPNTDVYYDPTMQVVHFEAGQHTPRCHAAGPLF